MPERDHCAEVLQLYNERFGQPDKYPRKIWRRAPQIMRDRGWSAAKTLDFLMEV